MQQVQPKEEERDSAEERAVATSPAALDRRRKRKKKNSSSKLSKHSFESIPKPSIVVSNAVGASADVEWQHVAETMQASSSSVLPSPKQRINENSFSQANVGSGGILKSETVSRKALDKLWSIYAAGNTVPIPFLRATDISPIALLSNNVIGSLETLLWEQCKSSLLERGHLKREGVDKMRCYEEMPLQDLQATQEQQTIQNLCDTLRTILRL